jgi:hypothetical protein
MPRLLARLLTAVALAALFMGANRAHSAPEPTRSGDRLASCTRMAIANPVIDFFSLVDLRRFAAVERLWLPRKRLETPGFFNLGTGSRTIRADRGSIVPLAARRWLEIGPPTLRVILLDPRPAPADPARSGYSVVWMRSGGDGSVMLGRGKGVWDCSRRRIAMLVGSERPFPSEEAAKASIGRPCGKRGTTAYNRGQHQLHLCRP